jgi:hypothetical protein
LSLGTHILHLTGMKNDSPGLAQYVSTLDDGTQNPALPSPSSDGRQTASRKRDRASTIRASDYKIKPVTSIPSSGRISTDVAALTTRTRSGTIRPVRPPVTSLASGFLATSQPCTGQQKQTPSGDAHDPLALVGSEKNSLGSSSSPRGKHMSRFSRVEATESMVVDMSSDESDDELLLDNKGWNWDGRWN